ncbi:uncharacterized protein LOC135194596 [Vanessa tameamea]|uniref:Uncharacterized protein LOC135194596 n=1 Tax=Vanessa tameamea TaxID=334116 RepID=A0ABM4AY97_VANTA
MALCGVCNNNISVSQKRIKCSNTGCNIHYHADCVKYNENVIHRSKWVCPVCLPKRSKATSNTNTPSQSKVQYDQEFETPPSASSLSLESIVNEIRSFRKEINLKVDEQQSSLNKFNICLEKMQEEVKGIINKFSALQNDFDEVTESLKFLSHSHDNQININEDYKNRIIELEKENMNLRTNITGLEFKMSLMEQQSRDCNLEIQCVPEHKSENLSSIVHQLASVVSFDLHDNDIVNFHRVAKRNTESKRPRSIIVKLSTPRKRDNFLAAVKVFNKKNPQSKLNSSHLGIASGKEQIYIMEHLSPDNKRLHAAARLAIKEKKYEYVWVRSGRIFVRRNDTSPAVFCLKQL